MKKLFTLLTMLVVAITSSWAVTFYIPTQVNNVTSNTTIYFETIAADGGTGKWYYDPSFTTESQTYTQITSTTDNGNPQGLTDGIATKSGASMAKVATNGNTFTSAKKVVHLHVKGVETVIAHGRAGSSGRGLAIVATEYNPDATDDYISTTGVVTFTRKSNSGSIIGQKTGLDATKEYIISIYGVSGDCYFYCAELIVPAGPTITTQPQSASYVTGDPIAALTVAATPNTSTFQWYSCDDADKTNAQPIEGATSASYTPTGAGFYYVAVTDGGVTVNSDVAQITVSEATAPTIEVTGAPAGDVVKGTEVTLTATATGTPTPTIKWYDSTDTEVGEGETYNVSTATAGTYVYYAKATNGVEPDAQSANQTIVVKEKVATPTFTPNGAYFETSQEVAIASATDGATIQYSTDNGESWNNYTAAFTVTATTTIKAKATKDGYINSDEATATFTKITLDPQVDVTGAATWDWSKFGTKEIKLTDQTTPSKTTEFVLSNAVNYGLCASIGSEFGNAQQLKVTTEYVVRETKFIQGEYVKFNTTVPGKITVVYSNTGNRTDEALRRFLNVNGINYGVGAMRSDETTTTTVSVAAGEVAITGKFGPSVEDQTNQYLRINTITFTPTSTETITIPEEGVATYVTKSALDFSSQNGAFKAYAVTNVGETSATTAEVGQVPAGTPLLIKGVAGDYDVEIVESADDIENLLQVSNGTVTGGDNIYAYSKTALKFKKVAATVKIPAGKCYLQANGGDALDIIFEGEATAINDVNANAETVAPVKVLTAKGVQIGKFNVAGQQVK